MKLVIGLILPAFIMVIVIVVIGYKCRKRSSNRNQNPQQNLAAPSNIHINHPRTFQMHGDGNIPTRPAENNTSPPSYEKVLLDSGGDTQMVYKVNEQGIGQYVPKQPPPSYSDQTMQTTTV